MALLGAANNRAGAGIGLLGAGTSCGLLDEVAAAVERYDVLITEANSGLREHVGAHADLEAVAQEVLGIVRHLDALNSYRLRDNPEQLAAWEECSERGLGQAEGGGRAGAGGWSGADGAVMGRRDPDAGVAPGGVRAGGGAGGGGDAGERLGGWVEKGYWGRAGGWEVRRFW